VVNASHFFISGFPINIKYQILTVRTLCKHNLTGVSFLQITISPNVSGLFMSVKHLELYRLVLLAKILPPHMVSDLYEQPAGRVAVYHATRRPYEIHTGQYIVMAQ
jgi:hypothetical protein